MSDLFKMMNMASILLLDDLHAGAQDFILSFLPDSGVHCASIPGIVVAEQLKMETIKDALVIEVFRSLKDVPHIPDVVIFTIEMIDNKLIEMLQGNDSRMQKRFSSVKIELQLQRKRKEVDTLMTEEKKLKKDSCDTKELIINQIK